MIAALYAALTVALSPLSFGPVQFRVAEALTLLPFFMPEAIPGLFIGCFLSNIAGGFGLIDISNFVGIEGKLSLDEVLEVLADIATMSENEFVTAAFNLTI